MTYQNDLHYSGRTFKLVMAATTIANLETTSLRGPEVRCAGNFFRWRNANAMFMDGVLMDAVKIHMSTVDPSKVCETHSFSTDFEYVVGWDRAVSHTLNPCESLPDYLEYFYPSSNTCFVRFKPSRVDLLAPPTRKVTVICKFDGATSTLTIFNIYPGRDTGKMLGDLTKSGFVFFEYNHPGADPR